MLARRRGYGRPGLWSWIVAVMVCLGMQASAQEVPAPLLTLDQDRFFRQHRRLVILKGLRHMALAEAPEAVNRPVVDFLAEVLR